MQSTLRSAAFVAATQAGIDVPAEVTSIDLPIAEDRALRADVYRPRGSAETRGTVLMIHGMTALGYRDPRIVALCRRLTLFGCTIVTPQYDEIANFEIGTELVDLVEQSVHAVLRHPRTAPRQGKIGILTSSFSTVFALMASCRPSMDGLTSSLCLIAGIYSGDVLLEILRRQDANDYPRHALMYNYVEDSIGPRPQVVQALRVALEDNSYGRTTAELPGFLESIDAEDRALFHRLCNDAEFRGEHAERFIVPIRDGIIERLQRLGSLGASVVLLHGEEDEVHPASESIAIHARLQALGVRTSLEVSPLLGHNKALALRPSLVPAVARIVASFARFFRDVAA